MVYLMLDSLHCRRIFFKRGQKGQTSGGKMKGHLTVINSILWCCALLCGFSMTESTPVYGDSLHQRMQQGSTSYGDSKYEEALKSFVDAQIESPENPQLKYNIANAHYKMRNYEEAIKNYQDVAATARDISLEETSLYNIGNCLYRQGKLEEAIEFYKKALDLDPDDEDAKYNLEFTREELKRRMLILFWYQEKQVCDFEDVSHVINLYYNYPERVIDIVSGEVW